MFWLADKTLEERFLAARRIVKFLKPRWTLPVSLPAFIEAQQRIWSHRSPALFAQAT